MTSVGASGGDIYETEKTGRRTSGCEPEIGPKTSSRATAMSGFTSGKTVGSMNHPNKDQLPIMSAVFNRNEPLRAFSDGFEDVVRTMLGEPLDCRADILFGIYEVRGLKLLHVGFDLLHYHQSVLNGLHRRSGLGPGEPVRAE
jgi:hypothetical protein